MTWNQKIEINTGVVLHFFGFFRTKNRGNTLGIMERPDEVTNRTGGVCRDELKRKRWLSVTMPLMRESADEIEGREKIQ